MLLEVRDSIHCCFPARGTGLGTDVALLEFVFNKPLCEATFLSPPEDHSGSELFVIKLYVGDQIGGKGLRISLPSCNFKDYCENVSVYIRDGSHHCFTGLHGMADIRSGVKITKTRFLHHKFSTYKEVLF